MPGAGANLTWPKTNSAPGLRTYRAVQNRGGFATLYILIQYLGSEVPVPYVKQKTIFFLHFLIRKFKKLQEHVSIEDFLQHNTNRQLFEHIRANTKSGFSSVCRSASAENIVSSFSVLKS